MVKNIGDWENKEWGNLLIIVGIIVLLGMVVGVQKFSMFELDTPIASVRAEGISEANVISLVVGFGLIILGFVIKKKG